MAELNKIDRCYHCGCILQTENEDEPGYISKEIIDKYPQGLLLCNNCFKNERYNLTPKQNDSLDEDYQKIIDIIKKKNALVVYVVDVFSFEGSFVSKLNAELNGLDVLAVANKADLLPKNTDYNHVLEYVAHHLRVAKLNVVSTVLVSSNNGFNIDKMYEKIIELSKDRDVYFIGASESGKSVLIKEFLKRYKNNTNKPIVTYTFKDTKLRGFKIPISNTHYIYETPGFNPVNSILAKVDKQCANAITPSKSIVPVRKTLANKNVLLLGGLALIQLESNEKVALTIYTSEKVEVYKTFFNDIKTAKNKLVKKKIKPVSSTFKEFSDFDGFDIEVTEEGNRDIGILGLGWISFKANKQKFRIFIPRGTYIYTTREKVIYVNK